VFRSRMKRKTASESAIKRDRGGTVATKCKFSPPSEDLAKRGSESRKGTHRKPLMRQEGERKQLECSRRTTNLKSLFSMIGLLCIRGKRVDKEKCTK